MPERFVDLSHDLGEHTPPFPGDPNVEIEVLSVSHKTDESPRSDANCSRIATCLHCGTHMDAPFHFFANGLTIDQIPLEQTIGPASLLDLRQLIGSSLDFELTADVFEPYQTLISRHPKLIVLSGWQDRWCSPEYFERHPVFTREGARYLVDLGIHLIGIDFPSVDHRPNDAHVQFLGNGTLIVENLTQLDQIGSDSFELIATPLAIQKRDGSPVRAVARVSDG